MTIDQISQTLIAHPMSHDIYAAIVHELIGRIRHGLSADNTSRRLSDTSRDVARWMESAIADHTARHYPT